MGKSALKTAADKKYMAYVKMCRTHGIDPETRGVWTSMNETQNLFRAAKMKKKKSGGGVAGLFAMQQSGVADVTPGKKKKRRKKHQSEKARPQTPEMETISGEAAAANAVHEDA